MINGSFCGKDEDLELVKHLRNIVLIINTNSEKQAATAGRFMRALYSRFFDTVVVIGPKSIPEYGVEGAAREMWPLVSPSPTLSPCRCVSKAHLWIKLPCGMHTGPLVSML